MPFKHNASRRHRIPEMKYKVTNWPAYEAGLRRRGSLTLWVTSEALAGWQAPRRKTRGGQFRYSDLAIETVLTLGCVFGLRLRQSEGLMLSLLDLMGLDLPVPDHTTLSRRAQTWAPQANQQSHPEDGVAWHLIGLFLTFCGSFAVSGGVAMGVHANKIEMVARPRGQDSGCRARR